jgi:hypothetical protein
MNSNDIRSQIKKAIEHEERTNTVAKVLADKKNTGARLTLEQQKNCLNFIKEYIRETPDIMDAVYRAAQQVGALNQVSPIFDTAFNYWTNQYDYIPDNVGLGGLMDDAYLTRMFLESVSNIHALSTGRPLLSIDLRSPNNAMRALIGEPIATMLDTAVGQTIAGQMIQAGLQQLGGIGAFNLNMPTLSTYDIQEEAKLRLGAMGVV